MSFGKPGEGPRLHSAPYVSIAACAYSEKSIGMSHTSVSVGLPKTIKLYKLFTNMKEHHFIWGT
jgi:hypothetical protein